MGKEGAGGVEKTWLESGTDVHQVCGTSFSLAGFSHVIFVGRMGWLSTGNSKDDPQKDSI